EDMMANTMKTDLAGKRALVCGASAGIGAEVARQLAAQGATVTLLARREERLAALQKEIITAGGSASYVVVDMDDVSGFLATISKHCEAHGWPHIVINNSGGPAAGPLVNANAEQFTLGFARDVVVAHELLKACLPDMQREQ